jgi:hypothetical protein
VTPDETNKHDGLETRVGPVPGPSSDAGASDDLRTTDLGELPTTRRSPSSWIRALAVTALVVVAGAAVAVVRDRGSETPPTDGAEVVARAGQCLSLTIEEDGWRFKNRRPDLPTDLPIGAPIDEDPAVTSSVPTEPTEDPFDGWGYPARWHGDHIAGRLYVDGSIPGSDQGGVNARFVAHDGTEISMYGHPPGAEVFENLACAIVGDPSVAITDRYAQLAADGPLPPVVGPAMDQPSGFQYAGMRATGSGTDRSIVLRFERPAQEAIPDAYQCIDGLPPDAPRTRWRLRTHRRSTSRNGAGLRHHRRRLPPRVRRSSPGGEARARARPRPDLPHRSTGGDRSVGRRCVHQRRHADGLADVNLEVCDAAPTESHDHPVEQAASLPGRNLSLLTSLEEAQSRLQASPVGRHDRHSAGHRWRRTAESASHPPRTRGGQLDRWAEASLTGPQPSADALV